MSDRIDYICTKTIEWSLILIVAGVPLIINPGAFDVWYRPKIVSVYTLVFIAGIAWFLKSTFTNTSFACQRNHIAILLLCYLIAALLSTIFSQDIQMSLFGDILRVEGFFTVLTYVALVFLFANQVMTMNFQTKLITGLIVGASLVSLYALIQYCGYDPTEHFFYKYWRRGPGVGSTIGNQNFLGKYLVLIIPIVFSQCFYPINGNKRLMSSMCLALFFAALMATFTRASWISAVVGITLFLSLAFRYALFADKTKQLILYILMFFVIGIIFNTYTFGNAAGENASFKRKEPGGVVKRTISSLQFKEGSGVATRLYVWEKALHLIKERPWFGYGLETFQITFRPYNKEYTKRFNDFSSIDRIHNNYLDTAFSMGIAGLASYLAIITSFLMYLWQVITKIDDKSRKLFFIGILSGFCGYLINDLFIFSVVSVSPTFWSLMGITLAAGRLAHADAGTVLPINQNSKNQNK